MPARIQLTLAAVLGTVAVVLGAVLLFGSSRANERPDFTVGPDGFAGAQSPSGARAPDFDLRDEDGKPISQRSARGRVTVLTFLYTTCEDSCPITASQILGGLDDLGPEGKDVATIAVSADPDVDDEALARRFLVDRRITGRMHFALGTAEELCPIWRAYGVQPQGDRYEGRCPSRKATDPRATVDSFEHSARVVVIDKRGFQRSAFPLDQLTSEALANDVRRLQAETP
ncbi:MAG: SCO family protein [Solirubrobacterales bacterium]|nr:SCO family protein [Solirubrobacterales bacterium]